MNLVTRCPKCATAFRVLPAQLGARSGQVRCGKCNTVFDGIAALVDASQAPKPPEAAPAPPADEPLPEFLAEPLPPRRGPWPMLAVLAALVLVAQALIYFRSEIAAGMPVARGPLEYACRLLACEMRLPRQVKLLSIESYEVRPDPLREGVIVLNAVIRNRAPFTQDYPALQLTLTDDANRDLVTRAILPREYLDPAAAARGIAAGGEASLTVHFDASRTRATGYELVLFYPS
ncbi:MAG TPA: DUF3426 domain-containing protein [Burkholderiales bacterium]|jgi:predicted Zn finger-like uncharacterized protein